MLPDNLDDYKNFAESMAYNCGAIVKNYFRKEIAIETKSDLTPLTIADRKAEECMREQIMKEFPQHGIIGEEFGSYKTDAEYKWILDPIDGTKSFLCGTVSFGTLVALVKQGKPLLGLFYQPVLDEMMIGDNKETVLNGEKVRVRSCKKVEEAVLITTDHRSIANYQDAGRFQKLIDRVKLYRNWGDCYGYYLLASGFVDIMIDPVISPWDSLPVIPIVRGAGGVITDYQGNDPVTGQSLIASVPEIHEEIVKILNE
jgi:myo-inositol-1(or 4)-monophosphatase